MKDDNDSSKLHIVDFPCEFSGRKFYHIIMFAVGNSIMKEH